MILKPLIICSQILPVNMPLPSTDSTIDDLQERIVEIQHALDVSLNDNKELREELDSTRYVSKRFSLKYEFQDNFKQIPPYNYDHLLG